MGHRWLVMKEDERTGRVGPEIEIECLTLDAAHRAAMDRADGYARAGQEIVYVIVEVPPWEIVREVRCRRIADAPSAN